MTSICVMTSYQYITLIIFFSLLNTHIQWLSLPHLSISILCLFIIILMCCVHLLLLLFLLSPITWHVLIWTRRTKQDEENGDDNESTSGQRSGFSTFFILLVFIIFLKLLIVSFFLETQKYLGLSHFFDVNETRSEWESTNRLIRQDV